jgi:hypothetical protein
MKVTCLWEAYQADQSYENCCRWLKHRAYLLYMDFCWRNP